MRLDFGHWQRVCILLLLQQLWAGPALAQNTAVVFGRVTDLIDPSKVVAGAIIIVTSPNLQGEQTAIAAEDGDFRLDQLPPGDYSLQVSAPGYKESTIDGVRLLVGRSVRVPVTMVPEVIEGETIEVKKITTSILDQGAATTGVTLTRDYMERVTTKRSFEAVAEATPGAQADTYGLSFAGTTSPENAFLLDGMNISNMSFGLSRLSLPVEFFDQVDIKTGGYLPEFGQATGGIVQAITKIGGNEVHGSVFSYTTPLRLVPLGIGRSGDAISGEARLNIRQDMGFEVGGAIIKDKLWFHVGFAPRIEQQSYSKRFRRIADADGNNLADVDENGPIFENVPGLTKTFPQLQQNYAYTANLTYNVSADHRLTVSTTGNPGITTGVHPGSVIFLNDINGDASAFNGGLREDSYTGLINYDGKFLNSRLLVNVKLGYVQHRLLDSGDMTPHIDYLSERNLADLDPSTAAECGTFDDGSPRCPVTNYRGGGFANNGLIVLRDWRSDRWTARATVSYLFELLGTHQLKAGFEFQRAGFFDRRTFAGGFASRDFGDGSALINEYGSIINPDDPLSDSSVETYPQGRTNYSFMNNYSTFLQDTWQIDRLNLNINGGVRIDVQDYFSPDGPASPGSGPYKRYFGFVNPSPRIGVVWDFLGNGRSKLFASYGRFYQVVPLDIATRGLPLESQLYTVRTTGCDAAPNECPVLDRFAYGGGALGIIEPLRGQFVHTITAGAEYQILSDLMVGASYLHSEYGDVLEDFSTDDGGTFTWGNPGVGEAANVTTTDRITGEPLQVKYPKPQRRYDALNLYVTKSLKRNFIAQASYTLSFLRGHFAGLFRPEDRQLDPNVTSELDLVDLLDNRYGYLAGDRTHQFKVDAAYIIEVSKRFAIIPNANVRVSSGTPYSYTGPHLFYGPQQAFLLSRGTAGRTDPFFQADIGIKAEYAFSSSTRLFLGLTFINVGNAQLSTSVDQRFVLDDQVTAPIRGGDTSDLRFLKTFSNQPVVLNKNFGKPTLRQSPMEMRIDAKLTF